MQKRYIVVAIVCIIVMVLVFKISGTYAIYSEGYEGKNIVDNNLNIIEYSNITLEGDASFVKDISSIGTTISFECLLPNPKSKISFEFKVKNMSKRDAELYAVTKNGLSSYFSEFVNFEVIPVDYLSLKNGKEFGSILKKNKEHTFRVIVSYQDNVVNLDTNNTMLNLSSTIIYGEK